MRGWRRKRRENVCKHRRKVKAIRTVWRLGKVRIEQCPSDGIMGRALVALTRAIATERWKQTMV